MEAHAVTSVRPAGNYLPHIEGLAETHRGDAEELLRVVERRVRRQGRPRPVLPPVEVGDDPARDADGVGLVGGEVVGEARFLRVHLGAAQLLVSGLPTGWKLEQS